MSLKLTTQIRSTFTKYEYILHRWLNSAKLQVKESTFARYHYLCHRYILPYLGDVSLSNINYTSLEEYITYLLHSGSQAFTGLSPKTVSDIYSIIKLTLDFAANQGYAVSTDYRQISIRKESSSPKILTENQQHIITSAVTKAPTLKGIGILFSMYTGIRLGEICALQWKNINFSEKTLTIKHTLQRIPVHDKTVSCKTHVIITEPKSKSSMRTIPIPTFLLNLAESYKNDDNTYILTGTQKFTEPRSMQNYFYTLQKKCKLTPVNYHSLRHTFATRCIELGFDTKTLSEILGHSNVSITLNCYVHSSLDLKKQYMEKLGHREFLK